MTVPDTLAEPLLWQSGLGFLTLLSLLGLELFIQRRGFAEPEVEHDDR